MDIEDVTLDDLWSLSTPPTREFEPAMVAHLDEPVRRYIEHAVAPLARAVRIQMKGAIKLDDAWCDFIAEQVIRWDVGLIWKADVRMGHGMFVKGSTIDEIDRALRRKRKHLVEPIK